MKTGIAVVIAIVPEISIKTGRSLARWVRTMKPPMSWTQSRIAGRFDEAIDEKIGHSSKEESVTAFVANYTDHNKTLD